MIKGTSKKFMESKDFILLQKYLKFMPAGGIQKVRGKCVLLKTIHGSQSLLEENKPFNSIFHHFGRTLIYDYESP